MVVVEIDDSNVAGREVVEQASVVEVQGHPPLRGELRVEMDHAADDGGRDGWWEAAESREGGVKTVCGKAEAELKGDHTAVPEIASVHGDRVHAVL